MKIAVMDLDSILYAIGNGNKVLDEKGIPIKVEGKFVYTPKNDVELQASADYVMKDILNSSGATHYIGYVKGKNTTVSRKEVHTGYKENRKKDAPPWWNFVKKDLINRWHAIEVDNWEVDDYVNVTRLQLSTSAFICAVDKDLLGLAGTHYNWRKKEWTTVTAEQAHYTFWSDMICGQTGDNIKGIPGKGPAFVQKLFSSYQHGTDLPILVFQEYLEAFGSHEGIFEYYRNYTALRIVDTIPLFIAPEPTPVPDRTIEQIREAESFFKE